jgi:hypothetical protein
MHDTATENGQRFFETYLLKAKDLTIVDEGINYIPNASLALTLNRIFLMDQS